MSDLNSVTVTDGYIELPVTSDPNTLAQAAFAALAAALPGWVPNEGQLDVLLIEQFAQMVSETAIVAAQVPLLIFQYFGSLVGITPEDGAPAQATSTWTMINADGYTVPAGTVVAYMTLGNVQVQFQTVAPFTVAPSATTATGIIIEAVVSGTANNGIADTVPIVLVNQLSYVASVAATSVTSGGADPEALAAYLNRLSTELKLQTPRPILPQDFAALAPQVAGVYRAVALNGLNPGRAITGATIVNTSPDVDDPAASFTNADVGRGITGTSIPGATTISSVGTAGRTLTTSAFTSGVNTLTDASGAFTTNDVGRTVSNANVPSGTTIASISSGTVAVMSDVATATASGETVILGALASCRTAVMSANATGSHTETVTLGDLTDQERTVTVAAVDIDGNALSAPIEANLSAYLEAQREVNFLCPVIAPTFSEIDVTYTAVALAGQDPVAVQGAATAALETYLSQANWGTNTTVINGTLVDGSELITGATLPSGNPISGVQIGDPIAGYGVAADTTITAIDGNTITMSNPATVSGTMILTVNLLGTWNPEATTVRYLALTGIVAATPGVDIGQPITLTFGIHGGSIGAVDVTLPGDAPLTQANIIGGTVTAAS